MDLSKLPRLSETQKQDAAGRVPSTDPPHPDAPAQPAVPEQTPPQYRTAPRREDAGGGPEVFINVVIGALVIYMGGWPVVDYLIHLTTGREFGYPVTDASGPVPYLSSPIFWQNLGALVFGLALILYGVLGRAGAALGWTVLVLMYVSAGINALAVVTSLGVTAFPLLSALCGAFSIYLGMYQWARIKSSVRAV